VSAFRLSGNHPFYTLHFTDSQVAIVPQGKRWILLNGLLCHHVTATDSLLRVEKIVSGAESMVVKIIAIIDRDIPNSDFVNVASVTSVTLGTIAYPVALPFADVGYEVSHGCQIYCAAGAGGYFDLSIIEIDEPVGVERAPVLAPQRLGWWGRGVET